MNPIEFVRMGADPEVALVDKNGNPVSVEGILGGTKEEPKQIPELPQGFCVQEDNVAAEYNIPPAVSASEFSNNILLGLNYIKDVVSKKGLSLAFVSSLHFKPEQLTSVQARTLGCMPDFNVWANKENPRPIPPPTLRTFAGHVHFGWFEPNQDQRVAVGKLFDLFLVIPSLLVTEPNERRQLYGRAGAVRFKSYGIECRALDNFWLSSRYNREFIFNAGINMIKALNKGQELLVEEVEKLSNEIQETINKHNKDWALELMARFDIPSFPRVPSNEKKKELYTFRV